MAFTGLVLGVNALVSGGPASGIRRSMRHYCESGEGLVKIGASSFNYNSDGANPKKVQALLHLIV